MDWLFIFTFSVSLQVDEQITTIQIAMVVVYIRFHNNGTMYESWIKQIKLQKEKKSER